MRLLILLAAVLGITAGLAFYKYGSLDPCRILAHDMAEDTVSGFRDTLGPEYGEEYDEMRAGAERLTRLATSQYSTGECVSELRKRWF